MIYFGGFIIFFTGLRLIIALFNLLGRQWLKDRSSKDEPRVSVLIPARNEEKNIAIIIEDILSHDYNNIDIWIYDDMSEDRTLQIIKRYADKDSRINIIQGNEPSAGWLGKNHACHCLSLHAQGEYLLFLDADVNIKKGVIKSAVRHVKKHHLALLSVFPVQKMHSFAEKITVPLMNWILLSLLPLILTKISSKRSFSAANGQFMFFDADIYHREKFHEKMRLRKVEDIAIFRYMKTKGYKVQTLLGNKQLACRMYSSWHDAVHGFSKNVFEFFGGSKIIAFLFALLTTFGFLPVLFGLPIIFTIAYFSMVILIRIIISAVSRQNIIHNLVLAPLQQLSFIYVIFKAFKLQKQKATFWKGRNIDV